MLTGKRVLLGVTGGIAAYKTAFLVRLLVKEGCEVKVVMTQSATEFVTPLTLATLSKNPVSFDFIDSGDGSLSWNNHVELGKWADLMLIAPATTNTLSKMANGLCDNLLLATYLSCTAPTFVAPAMDLDMYAHVTTKESLSKLESQGVHIIPVGSGFLASGLEGEGRMSEPEEIVSAIKRQVRSLQKLANKRVLISAGPTRESIDPVRFLSNRSTGTMGYELAREAYLQGADVTLVSGPVHPIELPDAIHRIEIESAREMSEVLHDQFPNCDLFISTAAVADFTPMEHSSEKIKKSLFQSEDWNLRLVATQDILASLSSAKKDQIVVGFALESSNAISNAMSKLKSKNLDAIALNTLEDPGAGFGTKTNQIRLLFADGSDVLLPLNTKREIARLMWSELIDRLC
ncbi:MAG: bifunctional phosphopantothenoylcysteine decarboxylase/phosphopantothenate--cysteine ligase CoaBC [Bacteroidetes bacterium]|nr:bifunctional phosphopantothenoylcysteine decarboxylase/phosphopantothenate--cysteine ligase CoaBC [Bacteroidota bacterium]